MNNNSYIGECVICRQGRLEILKEKETGKLFIYCEECEAEWETPQDALINQNGSCFKYGLAESAPLKDIKKAGWFSYITERP
jgi:hypothetical protein